MMGKLYRNIILKKMVCILIVSVMVLTQTDILRVNAMSDKKDTVTATESIADDKEQEEQSQNGQEQDGQQQKGRTEKKI